VIRLGRTFTTARLICLLTALLAFGMPSGSFAQTARTTAKKATTAKKPAAKKSTAKKPARKASSASVRRARLARSRAALRASQLKEAQEPRFKLDELGALVPDIRAEAAIIYNPVTGQVLWESNAQDKRSIASITKVMTAAVFLEGSPDLSEQVVVQSADMRAASTTHLRAGYTVSKDDLLHLLLIASDNAAARVLARTSPQGTDGFIRRMNEKAKELGLASTSYVDSSGLLSDNVSSALDMAKLITYVSGDNRIASIMRTSEYTVTAGRRSITIHSTNQLVRQGDVDVQAGKTGFISKAGYCLATLLRLPQGGPQVAVVILGAKSNAGRFWETRHLFNWLSAKAGDLLGVAPVEAATVSTAN
jgi:D-alanyl-D-alanine endopeptidase (penicillin-binding protein 7)